VTWKPSCYTSRPNVGVPTPSESSGGGMDVRGMPIIYLQCNGIGVKMVGRTQVYGEKGEA